MGAWSVAIPTGAGALKSVGGCWILATVQKPFASELSCLLPEVVMPPPVFWPAESSAS